MVRRSFVASSILLVCGMFLVGSVLAANGVVLQRSVVGGGGESVTDGSLYILNGTIGEPIVGAIAVGSNYGRGSGFWWPQRPSGSGGASGLNVYLPLVLKN